MKQIKIKFDKKGHYVKVVLFNTVKELQKATKDKEAAGLYHPEYYTCYPKSRVPKKIGTIYLAREKLGMGYITHEVLHCVMDYTHKVIYGLSDMLDFEDMEKEEEMCHFQGDLSRQIVNWLEDVIFDDGAKYGT